MFEPGDIVECVNAKPVLGRRGWEGDAPVVGRLYTVRDMQVDAESEKVVRLNELDRCAYAKLPWNLGPRAGYHPSRFRLLKRRDPELLHRLMYEPAPEQEHA